MPRRGEKERSPGKSQDPEEDLEAAYNLLSVGLSKCPDSAELKELAEVFEEE